MSEAHIGVPTSAEPDFYSLPDATDSARCGGHHCRCIMAGCIVRTNRRGGPADWLALCPHAEVRASSAFRVGTSRWELGISTVSALSNRSTRLPRPPVVMSRRVRLDASCARMRAERTIAIFTIIYVCFMRAKKICLRSDHRIHHRASNQPPSRASRAMQRARASHRAPARRFAPAFCASSRSAITTACPVRR